MERYLVFITTVLVITQIVRITQNTISLHRQKRIIKSQLDEIGEITDKDIQRKVLVDKLLVELLPRMIVKYEEGDINEQ